MDRAVAEQAEFLSTTPAKQKDRRFPLAVIIVSLLIFVALAPYARHPLPQVWAFIPIYESSLIISDIVTAVILLIQFNILRSRALLAVGCGYLFSALMAVPHALTFPGLFWPTGLIDAGPHTTAWLYVFWHGGLPIAVIAYALLKHRNGASGRPGSPARLTLSLSIGAVVGTVTGLTLLATVGQTILPDLMVGNANTLTLTTVIAADILLTLVALLILCRRRPHTVLDLWLMVVMCASLFDVALSALLNAGRFDLGFYTGRAYGLLAGTFVLVMLLRETGTLYAELANRFEAQRKDHERDAVEHRRTADRERLFGAAVQSSVDAIVTKTVDGVITGWNPAAEQLFGFAADEAVGQRIDIIVPEDRREELRGILARVRCGEIVEHHETVRRAKNGALIEVSLSISPIKLPSGEIIGACKIAHDITEQKAAEDKFKLAVEACPSGMLMADNAGRVVMVNTATEDLFGYRREELVGQSIEILVPEHLRVQHFAERRGYAAKPKMRAMAANQSLCGRRKDGTEFPAEIGLNPIQTRRGVLILCVILDITERKRLDRLKDAFVSTVSHELRTPLTSICGSLGLLMGTAAKDLPERTARLLSLAHSNSQRLVKLVNDILDIEKLEAGQIVFKFKVVELRPLIEQLVDANRGYADTYLVKLRYEIPADGEVWVDPDRLSQVVTNLISNAIKFSPPNGEVVIAVNGESGGFRLSVRDHGAGIPAEFKPRVFQKFAQADGTNIRKTGGTGLGLSIVKEIVTRLGGEVGFADAPGGGTIFYVDLPSAEQPAVASHPPQPVPVAVQSA
jgi:PAS domain S-box-containing protein